MKLLRGLAKAELGDRLKPPKKTVRTNGIVNNNSRENVDTKILKNFLSPSNFGPLLSTIYM
jgi:hypothetical protein